MEITTEFQWNEKTRKGLNKVPDDILYSVARMTLDYTVSQKLIPRDTGKMERSSISGGVRGSSGDFYIGSFTNYASRVWNLPQATTNWTNPTSKSQWYAYTLKKYGTSIIDNSINKSWKENM